MSDTTAGILRAAEHRGNHALEVLSVFRANAKIPVARTLELRSCLNVVYDCALFPKPFAQCCPNTLLVAKDNPRANLLPWAVKRNRALGRLPRQLVKPATYIRRITLSGWHVCRDIVEPTIRIM
jgi:hypothetical protein